MNESLKKLKNSVSSWALDAQSQGLLSDESVATISHFNEQTPASLFDVEERPLVVGFFGGTGVGKSTLLNRLAGEDVARTSAERPTSREVTMYLHSTVHVSHLPPEYPVDKIASAFHNNDKNRHILWIDMPDFDSAETANRQLVNDWLPHIDVLIYVVSPERYKDDNGWRLLLQHGNRHAWVFVINHWDRGNDAQRIDFTRMLIDAGLDNPMLFCTDSSGVDSIDVDEFNTLESTIQSMADVKTVQQLEAHGISVRVNEMQSLVTQAIQTMGAEEHYAQLNKNWDEQWSRQSESIFESVDWKFPLLAEQYRSHEPGFISLIIGNLTGRSGKTKTDDKPSLPISTTDLIDHDSVARINDSLDELVQTAATHPLPVAHIRARLDALRPTLPAQLNDTVIQSLRQSLAKPGTALQRYTHRTFAILSSVLPLLAMVWAGYRVLMAFYDGGSTPAAYLSSNFAINGLLLIGLAWLLPFFLSRKTKPTRQSAAVRGLTTGTRAALNLVAEDVREQINSAAATSASTASEGQALFQQIDYQPTPIIGQLDRVLISESMH